MRQILATLVVMSVLSLTLPQLAIACMDHPVGSDHNHQNKNLPPLVINGFANPESVVRDPSGKVFYVSNLGVKLAPNTKDGDGFISAVSSDGKILARRQFPKVGRLHAPKGMVIAGNTLYVTDVDRVVGFDLTTRLQVFETSLASTKTKFLNDLVALDDKSMLVSATDLGKVYRVTIGTPSSFSEYASLPGVNGLYREGNSIYAVSFGTDMKLNGGFGKLSGRNAANYSALSGKNVGGYDGVFRAGNRLYLTDWVGFGQKGVIRVYDLKKKKLLVLETGLDFKGPADFSYDRSTNRVWMPAMMSGNVYVFPLK